MRRLLSVLLSGVFLSGVLVAVDSQPASANAISLTFPSGDHRFSANEWESIATVTGTTPAVSGGTANADIRVTVQAVDNGALRLQVITDITAADSYDLNDFYGDSEGLEVISFYGKVDKVSAALASMELRRYVTGSASIEVSVNEGTGLVIGDSYYEVYTATLDWEEAAKAALSKTLPGTVVGVQCQGYLAAITSKEEQAAISSRVKTLSWLGGGDSLVLTNHAIDYIDPFDNGTQTYKGQNTSTSFTSATWSQSMQLLQLMVPSEALFLAIGQTVTISGASNSNLNGTYTVSSRVTYGTDETPTNYSLEVVSITDNQQTNLDAVVSGNLELEQSKTTEGKFHWLFGPERGAQISLDNGDEQLGELLNSGDPGFPAGYPESGQTNNGFLVGRDINDGLTVGDDSNLRMSPAADHVFQNWNGKEPNNAGSGENAIVMLANGLWNDLPQTGSDQGTYLVEYGGLVASAGHESDPANISFTNLDHVGDIGACETVNAASVQTASFTAKELQNQPAEQASSAAPYYGPISRPLARVEVIAGEQANISGFRLDVVEKVTVGNQELELVSKQSSALVVVVSEDLSGIVHLNLHWKNGERTGVYRVSQALDVSPLDVIETTQTVESPGKVNAGSFKGYVAVYALGYEGSRLSAKIGNNWVIVDPIVNNQSATLARIVQFIGLPGVDIQVLIYIDRVLVDTIPLTTIM